MGHSIYYVNINHPVGDISVGRWREIRRIFPVFLEYINSVMLLSWELGTRRNVIVRTDGTVLPPAPKDGDKPTVAPFTFEGLIRDESDGLNEIYIESAYELLRMIAWFDFLVARDGAASLYAAFVEVLRPYACEIETYVIRPID